MRKTFDVNIYIETDTAEARRQYRGYGVIVEFLLKNGEPVTRDAYGLADATGNQIMLMALIDALKILTKPCNVIIYMDNRYVSENIRLGHIYEWFANGWKTLRNEPIANAEEWRELMGLIEGHELAFAPTKEHSYKECLQYAIRKLKDQGENWQQQRLID
ncbi:MAG: hypothetical protein E7290_09395 [Lachnospiraceae bacterium]|nr:hypothetical protein [Lachnospiraceae bacterium]